MYLDVSYPSFSGKPFGCSPCALEGTPDVQSQDATEHIGSGYTAIFDIHWEAYKASKELPECIHRV